MQLFRYSILKFFFSLLIWHLCFPSLLSADTQSFMSYKRYKHFNQIIVFGDSLVDVGNDPIITFIQDQQSGVLLPGLVIPPPTRYDRGRFSNGPVIVDYLSSRFSKIMKPSETGVNLNKDNVSYAFGGSETGLENFTPGLVLVPGLKGQVLKFEKDLSNSERMDINNTLIIIWTGSNDYLFSLFSGEEPNPNEIVGNIVNSLEKLSQLGARRIVVANLPDLGKTPICETISICELLSDLTETHNDLLAASVRNFNSLQNSNRVILFDANFVIEKIFIYRSLLGFSENIGFGPASGCLFQPLSEFQIENCSLVSFNTDTIYWDEIHPTTKVHKILARVLWKKIRDFSGYRKRFMPWNK